MEFQTRSEENGLRQFSTFNEAYQHSKKDKTVWKISFTIPETGERIRLLANNLGVVLSLSSFEKG